MSLKALCRGTLAAAALAALGAADARAQVAYTANTVTSVFYREFKKDGRFFVFNNPAGAAAFEQSGETGVGITRVGIGPNGETVFADNETALELFLFKYNVTAEVKRPAAPPLDVVWRDGKTRFTLGSAAYLEMSTRLQPRFTLEMPDDRVTLPGTPGAGDSKGSFRIRRAKFKLEGWFYKPSLEFEFQMNFTDVTNTPASQMVEDANIDWDISKKKRFRVKFGQFKAPFGRQQLTSSGAQQFVDRAIQDARYNDARETGISLWGTLGGNKLDYRVMMSNGFGRTQVLNDNNKYLWTGRLMWQAIGNTRMDQWGSGALLDRGRPGRLRRRHAARARRTVLEQRPLRRDHGRRPAQQDVGRRLHLQVQGFRERRGVCRPRLGVRSARHGRGHAGIPRQGLPGRRRPTPSRLPASRERRSGSSRSATPSSIRTTTSTATTARRSAARSATTTTGTRSRCRPTTASSRTTPRNSGAGSTEQRVPPPDAARLLASWGAASH